MDPQSQSFTPCSSNNDVWRLQSDVARIQQLQQEHGERLARLERRQDDDARMKSVWGNSSPFPSVLSGTPQQSALQHPPNDQFRNFDDESNNMMSSLHLDADDEPRRGLGATSRANSVRFDETANQNHFAHSSRPSFEFGSRASSGLGGLQMTERSLSHKSDGRASSAHSIRSAASGRANSLNLDTIYPSDSSRSPLETPGLAPGLLLLGSVPAIIRCWMNTNFKHDALLYAAVCTGSYKSFLNSGLIQKLGFEESIVAGSDGSQTVELPVFFPEAVPHPASSRSSSPAPQLPTLTVSFHVVDQTPSEDDKAIQIFIGSDVLRQHSADILFSSNSMTLFDDDRSKLSIPLVRPENEAAFRSLYITCGTLQPLGEKSDGVVKEQPYLNGLSQGSSVPSVSSAAASPPPEKSLRQVPSVSEHSPGDIRKPDAVRLETDPRPESRQSNVSRPSLSLLNTRADAQDPSSGPQSTSSRSGSSPAIWSSWRREGPPASAASSNTGMDWATAGKNRDTSYLRKDTGIKVLKPKIASRTASSSLAPGSSANASSDGRSRYFDEGRRKNDLDGDQQSRTGSSDIVSDVQMSPPSAANAAPKTKSNPIGGGSAFSWLNSGGGKK